MDIFTKETSSGVALQATVIVISNGIWIDYGFLGGEERNRHIKFEDMKNGISVKLNEVRKYFSSKGFEKGPLEESRKDTFVQNYFKFMRIRKQGLLKKLITHSDVGGFF